MTRFLYRLVTALSMAAGRGPAARVAVELAAPRAGDAVVDVGCGPGTAARAAQRAGASVVGIDPDPLMLALARPLSLRRRGVRWVLGRAESLPLPGGSATIVWALSSLHDWENRAAGIAEVARVLASGGRFLVLERLVAPGARGHAAHGLTAAPVGELANELRTAGFAEVSDTQRQLGSRVLAVVDGRR